MNSAPVAVDDSYQVHGYTQLGYLLANDYDPDGDNIGFALIVNQPQHGVLAGSNLAAPTYEPERGFTGTDSFTYRICDSHGSCSNAGVTLNVTNAAPVAVSDTFHVHGFTQLGNLLANDYDTNGDNIGLLSRTNPQHGGLSGSLLSAPAYEPEYGYVGADSFTYRIVDSLGAESGNATVTLDITNEPPVPVSKSFTVHGPTPLGNLVTGSSDPEGDGIGLDSIRSQPQHGGLTGSQIWSPTYEPEYGYVGPDSFTFRIIDSLGARSGDATVTLNVVNNPPAAIADFYVVRKSDITRGNGLFDTAYNVPTNGVLSNDFDLDGDGMGCAVKNNEPTAHGYVSIWNDGRVQYIPNSPQFTGFDSTTYIVGDKYGARSTGVIWFFVIGSGENDGAPSCNSEVGKPVNVTNGNMYLQQQDYKISGAGGGLEVIRSYNSNSEKTGLFGKGWTTAFDEALTVYDNNLLGLTMPDGRAVYFGRGDNGPFTTLTPDFYGQISQNAGGYALSMKDGRSAQFSSTGRLLSFTDRNDNQTTLTYDGNGKLTQVTDTFGRVLSVTTDSNGRVTSLSDALGSIATYGYSASGELQSVTYPDNSRFDFTYSTLGTRSLLTTVTDALGHVVESHTYDSQGRATTSEVEGGVEHYTLNYVNGTETDVTDALGHVTKYFFDSSKGRNVVTRIEGSCACGTSNVQTWTYDNQLNVTSKTDAVNHTTSFTYDTYGNLLTATNALGTATLTYNSFGEILTVTDPMNGVTTNTYDAHGNLLTTKDALNHTTTSTYDARGQLLTIKDALNNTTTLTWDTSGRLTEVKDAANHTTSFAHDARGRVTSVTNALNETTTCEYDAAGRLKKVVSPDTSYIQHTYDLGGRRTKVRDARGNETTFAYDGANHLTGVTNADNQTTSYGYNLMSRLTSVTDALNRTTNYEYDGFNRLKKTIYPAATTGATRLEEQVEYDAVGNVKKRIDTAGRETLYDYDAANRLVKVTDPALQATQYEYNARSQMTAVVDPLNQRYEFAYDAMGRATQITRGGLSMSYDYDAVGNRTSRTDYNNQTTSYAYDSLNRLTTVTYPDTTTVSYSYDQLSRLASATNANGTVGFSYDNRGRVSSATDVFNQTVGYGYDANGNRTSLSLGQATSATYQYDVLNRLTQITDSGNASVGYAYDATSKLTSRTLPNGVTATYQYDGLNRLTRLTDATSTATIADAQYQYNTASQITQITEPSQTRNFGYDAVDRLTSVQNPSQTVESYSYDGVGNRTASHISSSYSYQPFNRVVTIGSNSYVYDNNGNLTSKTDAAGTWSYSWDYENRLKQVTRPDATTISYKYDALGRRIQRSKSGGGSTNYVYDGGDVIRDINSDGSSVDYLNGLGTDDKLRQTSSAGTVYFSQDHLGSTRALTNASGTVVENISYDSFGNGSSSLTRYGYTGREWDADANLYYYRNRWYSPQEGRFISADPIGLNGGINPYAYVGNNPNQFTDSSGLRIDAEVTSGRTLGELVSFPQDRRQPEYDWDGVFQSNFWSGVGRSCKTMLLDAKAMLIDPLINPFLYVLSQPEVQFAGAGMAMPYGMPYTTPYGGLGGSVGVAETEGVGATPAAAPGSTCFVAGTKVQTASGEKNIEDISAGDVVLSVDQWRTESIDQQAYQKVEQTFVRTAPVVLDIHAGGETITATPEHRFWVVGAGWTAAGELRRGSALLTKDGVIIHVDYVDRREGQFKVYNFEVADTHTYYVSSLGVLVHNQYGPTGNAVIQETLSGTKSFVSAHTLDATEALDTAEQYLGPGYRELGKPTSGVYRSADGLRGFRMDPNSLQGLHQPNVPHVHFELFTPNNVRLVNNHVPFTN